MLHRLHDLFDVTYMSVDEAVATLRDEERASGKVHRASTAVLGL
jgi:hypothetical protein